MFCKLSIKLLPASFPRAVLESPVTLATRAFKPMAVLTTPVVLVTSAASPIAVLNLPVVSLRSAREPMAVFPAKSGGAIQFWSAPKPTAVSLSAYATRDIPEWRREAELTLASAAQARADTLSDQNS